MCAEKRSIRVLIVDDMPQVRHDLQTVLQLVGEQAGISALVVGEAGDGQEAIRLARILQPEVVLMDLAIPVMDGCLATQAIKAENSSIRVIVLTVHSTPAWRAKACLAGADAFIEKGQPLEELLQAIGCTALS